MSGQRQSVLAGDVGGTHARLALFEVGEIQPTLLTETIFPWDIRAEGFGEAVGVAQVRRIKGEGVGRGSPLVTGERGHYELAAGRSSSPRSGSRLPCLSISTGPKQAIGKVGTSQ